MKKQSELDRFKLLETVRFYQRQFCFVVEALHDTRRKSIGFEPIQEHLFVTAKRFHHPPKRLSVGLRSSIAPRAKKLHAQVADARSAMSLEMVAQRGKDQQMMFGQERDVLRGHSPGQLFGIVFAGANRKPAAIDPLSNEEQPDDGIMTADEIAFLRLEEVRLVVLSACETGLGEVACGEALLGIQRGFQIAGARSTVASLWKIDDLATRKIMERFYTNVLEKSCRGSTRFAIPNCGH